MRDRELVKLDVAKGIYFDLVGTAIWGQGEERQEEWQERVRQYLRLAIRYAEIFIEEWERAEEEAGGGLGKTSKNRLSPK
jgi:hypothetical protein